jgi:drug/metabolite transporter (DMT)-like permease
VAYLLPVWGIVLGAVVLNDPITVNRIAGTALVIAGIALVNSGPALRRVFDRSAATERLAPAEPAADADAR